jgi:putative endonuclease
MQDSALEFNVYILHSETSGRYYCGQTNNLKLRLAEHNDPAYHSTRTTKVIEGPWKLVWTGKAESRSDAMKQEKAIKQRGIRRFLEGIQQARAEESSD